MNKKYIGFVIILITLTLSCSRLKDDRLYNHINESATQDYVEQPIIVKISNDYDNDTIICCITANEYFKIKRLNNNSIQIDKLYNIIKKDEIIIVDLREFECFYKFIISENKDLLSINKNYGIDSLLNRYTKNDFFYPQDLPNGSVGYFIYLCFINDIFVYWDDESGGYGFKDHK